MNEHMDHIVPEPGCERCSRVVTPADVKRWILERVGDVADRTDIAERLRVAVNPDDPSVVDITFEMPPIADFSIVTLHRGHDS